MAAYDPNDLTRLKHLLELGDQILNVTDGLDHRVTTLEEDIKGNAKVFYNTTDYWNNHKSFIPPVGSIVIYSDHGFADEKPVPAFKVGDGNAYLIDIPFSGEDIRRILEAHIIDTSIHLSEDDRAKLNESVTCNTERLEDGSYRLMFSNN